MTDTPQEPDPKDSPPAKPPRLSLDEHGRIVYKCEEDDATGPPPPPASKPKEEKDAWLGGADLLEEGRGESITVITRYFSQGWQVLLLWPLAVLLTAVWMASPESSRVTVVVLAVLYALALLATRRWLREQKGRAEPPTNY